MRISGIAIERYGIWRDLNLPLHKEGLTVFYGPNEAGKTTLMRFIRRMLYGFHAEDSGPIWVRSGQPQSGTVAGTLHVSVKSGPITVHRTSRETGADELVVETGSGSLSDNEFHASILQGITEDLFNRVFAIGLHELQELATLETDALSEHIYHTTLGPEGRRLLKLSERIRQVRQSLLGTEHQQGTLGALVDQHDRLGEQIVQLDSAVEAYGQLLCNQRDLVATIEDLKSRQAGIQEQLRGHEFLKRIWTPWNRLRQYEEELGGLSVVTDFPEQALARLDEIDGELTTATNCRDLLIAEVKELHRQTRERAVDPEFARHAGSIQSLVDQKPWLQQLEDQIAGLELEWEASQIRLERHLEALGNDWTIPRLSALDTTPSAQIRILDAARRFERMLARRSRLRHRYEHKCQVCQHQTNDFNDRLKPLAGLALDDALARTKQTLRDVYDQGRLKLKVAELQQRREGIQHELKRFNTRLDLPAWSHLLFGFFAVAGFVLAMTGVATGLTTNAIVGAIYALLGITSASLAWAFRTHFKRKIDGNVVRLHDEQFENAIRLRETQQTIASLSKTVSVTPATEDGEEADAAASIEEKCIKAALCQLTELERLVQQRQDIQNLRHRLSDMRTRLQTIQGDVSQARQQWCGALTQSGLPETVRIDQAFEIWHQAIEARPLLADLESVQRRLQDGRQTRDAFRQRIETLAQRLQIPDLDLQNPSSVLDVWEETLDALFVARKDRRRLRRETRLRRKEARQYAKRIQQLTTQRAALLVQGGAASREEFEYREMCYRRRRELAEQIEQSRTELEKTSRTEPELAIVEEDLLAFEPAENDECIRTLRQELADLERDLQQAFERMGRCKQEIANLEHDRTSADLRLKQAEVFDSLKQTAARWLGLELAAGGIDKIRTQFEKHSQPAALRLASQYLERLSEGRYPTIWTLLDERRISVDNAAGTTFAIEQLSGGTREQLFLAIRFALLDQFAQRGVEFPVVLDDVLVNFDQSRTEVAVNQLIALARQGRQLLFFTCHQHLAQLFQAKGTEPIRLPEHGIAIEERRAG